MQPLTKVIKTPRQVCKDVAVNHQAAVQHQHQISGMAIGALAGDLLGSPVGAGSGNKPATVAGAAAGGYAGKKVQKNMQAKDTYNTTEARCTPVTDEREKIVGYDVEYRFGEQAGHVQIDHAPGPRAPVKDGKLVLSEGQRTAEN